MRNCVICNNVGKYKCPTCFIYYCSTTCCKKHRDTKCEVSQDDRVASPKPESYSKLAYPTEDTVPADKLKLLGHSKEVKHLLENPHLRNLLQIIDSSDKPDEIMQKAMQEPLFVEFADACLAVVEPRDDADDKVRIFSSARLPS